MVPIITNIDVYPVAGKDSMLLNLSGAHMPYFTRNIVIMTDSTGAKGVGEVPGGKKITEVLNSIKYLIIDSSIADYKNTLLKIKSKIGSDKNDNRGKQTFDQRTGIHVITALETPFLDLLGKYLEVPVAALLGNGIQHKKVKMLGYLFYIADREETDLPYYHDTENKCEWYRVRHERALTTDKIISLANAAKSKYGFTDFKLKGGVLTGREEIETIKSLKESFPDCEW